MNGVSFVSYFALRALDFDLAFPLRATFIALPLEQEAKWQFQALQETLKEYRDILSFQNPQTPHLTLQYWSEVMEIEYYRIVEQAEAVASKFLCFVTNVTEADTFGSRGEDRVLFLTLAFSEELARLRKSCPWVSGKPFHPHITLARVRHPQKFAVQKKRIMKRLRDCSFPIPCDRLRLYAEIAGRKQTPLQDFLFESEKVEAKEGKAGT